MKINLKLKKVHALVPTDILFQTSYWGRVKSSLGWHPMAFDFQSSNGQYGDILILIRPLGHNYAAAYVPQGPETEPDPEQYGLFLETLSQELIKYMPSSILFIRYDLPWRAPYAYDITDGQQWCGHPLPQLRELRMNIGTRNWNLRKSTIDHTVADTLFIDLVKTEGELFADMKSKTRYNIRPAHKKDVHVLNASEEKLPVFYDLYLQTAKRNGFHPCSYRHFHALFLKPFNLTESLDIIFFLATKGQDVLAGAIIAVSRQRALYLFGASADEQRNLMGSYALQWEIIKALKNKRCLTYDMGAVSPTADRNHPFYGMYRFKTGFGGKVIHRNGSWDYPVQIKEYKAFRHYESLSDATNPFLTRREGL